MAYDKYRGANVAYQVDTFGAWLEITNQIINDLSLTVVTSTSNTTGSVTTGNVVITSNVWNNDTSAWVNSTGGALQSNVITVVTELRGGTIQTPATLLITSNVDIYSGVINATSNSTAQTVSVTGTWANFNSITTNITGTALNISSNVTINSLATNFTSNAVTTTLNGTTLVVNNAVLTVNTGAATLLADSYVITANDFTVKANSTVTVMDVNNDGATTDTTMGGDSVTFDNDETNFNANVTLGSASSDTVSFNAEVDTTVTPASNALSMGTSVRRWNLYGNIANISGTLDVSGLATLSANVVVGTSSAQVVSINALVNTSLIASANGTAFGNTLKRWDVFGTTADFSALVTGNSLLINTTANVTGVATFGANADITGVLNGTTAVFGNTSVLADKVTVGNSTVNTAVSAAGVDTDGTLAVGGITTLSANVVLGGTITSVIVQSGASANIANGKLYINSTSMAVAPNTVFANDVSIAGNLIVTGATTLATSEVLSLNTSTIQILTVVQEANLNGNTVLGNAATDTIIINGIVGNTTVGVIPGANGTAFGNTISRWDVVANSANFANTVSISGLVTAAAGINLTGGSIVRGNTTISATSLSIGNTTVNTAITQTSINTDGTLNVLGVSTLSANVSVGGQFVSTGIATHSANTLMVGAVNMSNTANVAGAFGVVGLSTLTTANVTGAFVASSTADIVGDLTIRSNIIDEGGNPFKLFYANGDVAWPQP